MKCGCSIYFSSIVQNWFAGVRISRSISGSPFDFEITRVDCIAITDMQNIKNCNRGTVFERLAGTRDHWRCLNQFFAIETTPLPTRSNLDCSAERLGERHLSFLSYNATDSRYLEVQGALWNTPSFPYLNIIDLQNWGKNKSNNEYVIWLMKVEIYWKHCAKEEKFLLFSTICSYMLLDFHV